jgi:Cu+-exporting ATPase
MSSATTPHHSHPPGQDSTDAVDPVCGMTVDPARAAGRFEHAGQTYYFCCRGCLEKFKADPARYLTQPRAQGMPVTLLRKGGTTAHAHPPDTHASHAPRHTDAAAPPPAASLDAEYTCPMHPEVRQKGPGSCPICGMALEPVAVTLDEQPNEELDDMVRRFRWSVALTAPILGVMIAELLPGRPLQRALTPGARAWVEMALATPVVLWGGWPFFVRGWASLVSRNLNMFTLIALGVGAAYGYSVVATLAPGLVPASFGMDGEAAIYFEPAAVIVTLVLLGQVLELRARSRTGSAIRALLRLAPTTARRD